MLQFHINYYHNRFFCIKDNYYVYVLLKNNKNKNNKNTNNNNNYKYDFKMVNDELYFFIIHKNLTKAEDFSFKLIHNGNELTVNIRDQRQNYIKIGALSKYHLKDKFKLENNCNSYDINSGFSIDYYIENNNLIDKKHVNNHEYVRYHWALCGSKHPYLYFKYLLKKYETIIENIPYPKITYDMNKKNTLLFIDTRYNNSFIYLLRLFLYSVDESWNIRVVTIAENVDLFKKAFNQLNVDGKIDIIEKEFRDIGEYSKMLTDYRFWESINEENCLLFQYDSFCMGKFEEKFFDYNYIGARWPHSPCLHPEINIGNGGTSFRKTRIMEYICRKYKDIDIKKYYAEDLFFAELLYEERLHNCTEEIADRFSFENIYNENSIYAHQIYNTVRLDDMDKFVSKKINDIYMKNIL